ncbi:MAG: hypothetical protein H6684_13120 [Deltaproteobacteria bacterium]|nr:hypothetical protein [bacterium]MCB9489667.1 hypothetical protein [Deltaproteobacteria bacterium]
MSTKALSVGGEVEAKCGACKAVRSHVIIAMVDGRPARVECLACHAVHNYRPAVPEKTVRKHMTASAAPRRSSSSSGSKASGRVMLDPDNAVDYSPKGNFEPGQTLRHKTFGLGLILRVEPKRMTVSFGSDVKMLILMPA